MEHSMRDRKHGVGRREFLTAGGASRHRRSRGRQTGRGRAAGRAGAAGRAANGDGAHRVRRDRSPGIGPRQQPAEDRGLSHHGRVRRPIRAHGLGDPRHRRRRTARARPPTPGARATSSGSRETEDLDLVYTATPWEWHVPVMLAAMKNGKHAATEVPAAMTVDDCWALVEASEKYRKHAVMMENCNYDRMEMMVFNMARQGLFGELLHAEGGYLHDLRAIKFENRNEGLWRRAWSQKVDGNPYPTHGLGPLANCLDINRGDRFDYLVSMSGPSRGLQDWAREHFPADAPERQEQYVLGDVNTSLIKTERGRTIMVQHCTNLPRPYSRIHLLQGTKGLFQGYPNRVYIEGRGKLDQWIDAQTRSSASSSIRSGRRWARGRPAPATAAWTSSRTTGSLRAFARVSRPT